MSYDIPRMKKDSKTVIRPMAPSPTPTMPRPKPPPPLLTFQERSPYEPNQKTGSEARGSNNEEEDDAEQEWLEWCSEQEKTVQSLQGPPTLKTVPETQHPSPALAQGKTTEPPSLETTQRTSNIPSNPVQSAPNTTLKSNQNRALSNPKIRDA